MQLSPWADLAGVPVALLGLISYVTVLASLALPEPLGRVLATFVSQVGFGFSAWLTYVELEKLDAVCQWCVASALVMTALAGVSVARMLRDDERASEWLTYAPAAVRRWPVARMLRDAEPDDRAA